MDSEAAATNSSSSLCMATVPSTATTASSDAAKNHTKDADGLHGDDKRPLQIDDQCHVQWYGTNPNSRMDSNNNNNNDNNGTTTTTSKQEQQVTTTIGINLPAIVVERRIARKKTKRPNDEIEVGTAATTSSNRINVKRQRNSIGHGRNSTNNTMPVLGVTTVKKEMYDTLPADALEYYVHYVDHDRRLDEWVTFDRFQLHTLRRHNQPTAKTVATVLSGTKAADSDDTRIDSQHHIDNIVDNNSTDEGDGDAYSDSGTVATTGTATVATRSNRRHHRGKDTTKNSNDTGSGKRTATTTLSSLNNNSLSTSSALTNVHSTNLLSSESDHGSSVFSFRGGNWHARSSSSSHADPASAAFEREHEETTKVKNIETIVMGSWLVAAWYYSPFPAEYSDVETLYVCEFCLSYMKKRKTLKKHKVECTCRQPPGKEIYRHEDISVYELDGKEHRAYCQKLCLLAKLFLDHKTLYYDVTPFYFYVVTKVDCHGAHIVGYFSKEKVSNEGYNLACILTFPQYQQAGYGKFIISLSYELTKREGKTGSPEKPLSDLGKVSYRSYWTHILMHLLAKCDPNSTDITVNDMSQLTGIKTEDILSTLQSLDMIKVWKGQHVVYVQQPIIDDYMKLNKKLRLCHSEYLKWEPPAGRPNKDMA